MSLTIQKAESTALPVLAALHETGFEEPWDRAALAKLLAMPGAFALLALEEETPCGFILMRCAADEAEVLTIATRPESRGKGAGRLLLEAAMREAAAAGAARFFLEVAENNAPARALYEKAGFAVTGKRPGYYRQKDGAVTAVVMSLER